MKRTGRKKEWSVALFGFALLAFLPPILTIFDRPVLIAGIPLTYLFLFGIWLMVIIAIAVGARRRLPAPVHQDISTLPGDSLDLGDHPYDNSRGEAG